MPLYTMGEDSLAIKIPHRVKEILERTKFLSEREKERIFSGHKSFEDEQKYEVSDSELNYLVNAAAKWETFKNVINDKQDSEIKVLAYKDNSVYIGEVLHDLITETDCLSIANFSEDFKYYKFQLQTTFTFGEKESDIDYILSELKSSLRFVKNLENDFLNRGVKVKVQGYFESVEKEGIELLVCSDSDLDELKSKYIDLKTEKINRKIERETKQKELLEKRKFELENK